MPELVRQIIAKSLWQSRFVPQSKAVVKFKTFREFAETPSPEGLGSSLKILYRLCADDPAALDCLEKVQPRKHGGDRRSSNFKMNNVKLETPCSGNSSHYSLKRLRQGSPELHSLVLARKISINQAMIKAGYKKKTIQITTDLQDISRIIKKHFTSPEIEMLIVLLQKDKF